MRQGWLAGRYPAAAAMVIFALVPYLGLSAALQPLTPIIGRQLHMSMQTMSLGLGMANAGYAVGTVLAVQFAQLLPQRRMMVLYAALLVIGSIVAAAAQNPAMFIAGHVLQGLCTSLLLIAAVPPLALGFGIEKFRWTAMIMNVCIFGAVALGPVVGGIQASAGAWRPLFWIVAGISLAALLLSLLTFDDAPPADRDAPRDAVAIGLAASGCALAFFGASELLTHRFLGPLTLLPLVVGLALIVTLVVNQYRSRRPLLTIRTMLTSTIPVAGIVLALAAAAASVSATVLTANELAPHYSPVHLGLLYLPELGGALITAVALGVVINKRQMHYLPLRSWLLESQFSGSRPRPPKRSR
jgi:MFS family permease